MAATDLVTPEPRRVAIRLPRPLWIGVAAVVLIVVAVGLRIGDGRSRRRQQGSKEMPPAIIRAEFNEGHVTDSDTATYGTSATRPGRGNGWRFVLRR